MKKILTTLLAFLMMHLATIRLIAQNVGIGTTTPDPTAKLHIDLATSLTDGFLITGTNNFAGSVPDLNAGTRMMFYPAKGAFRAGTVTGIQWNNSNVGEHSAAFGYDTKASNSTSFAAGYGAVATGARSLSIGSLTQATGYVSTALGNGTQAIGDASTAFGAYSSAVGTAATAMGNNTNSDGNVATSMGYYTNAQSFASVAMGQFNDALAGSDLGSWLPTDPLLILGNGVSNAFRSNAFVVYKNGNTDINGYTQLGKATEFAPAIKMKKITGTTAALQNTWVNAPHGLSASKILSVSIIVDVPGFVQLPPSYTYQGGYEYQYQVSSSSIVVINSASNSSNILSKAFRILITYEE